MRLLRSVVTVSLVLMFIVSCATINPEKRYLGQWRTIHEGETFTASFEKNHKCVFAGTGRTVLGEWALQGRRNHNNNCRWG